MKPIKIWANLGVENIERTQEFYLTLGFKLNGKPTKELVSFLFGDDDFVIHFFLKEKLKSSLEGEISDLSQGNEIIFTLYAENKDDFDTWIEEVKNAGGTIFSSTLTRTGKNFTMKMDTTFVYLLTRMVTSSICSTAPICKTKP
jgi:uncharacterized protein